MQERSGRGWRWIKSTCRTRSTFPHGQRKVRAGTGVPPVPGQGRPGAQLGTTSFATWTLAGTARDSVGICSPFPQLSRARNWFSSLGSSLRWKTHADLGATAALWDHAWGEQDVVLPRSSVPGSMVQNQATAHPGLSLLKLDTFFLPVHKTVSNVEVQNIPFWTCGEHRNTEPFLFSLKNMYLLEGFTHVFQFNEEPFLLNPVCWWCPLRNLLEVAGEGLIHLIPTLWEWGAGYITLIWRRQYGITFICCLIFLWPETLPAIFVQHQIWISFSRQIYGDTS